MNMYKEIHCKMNRINLLSILEFVTSLCCYCCCCCCCCCCGNRIKPPRISENIMSFIRQNRIAPSTPIPKDLKNDRSAKITDNTNPTMKPLNGLNW